MDGCPPLALFVIVSEDSGFNVTFVYVRLHRRLDSPNRQDRRRGKDAVEGRYAGAKQSQSQTDQGRCYLALSVWAEDADNEQTFSSSKHQKCRMACFTQKLESNK